MGNIPRLQTLNIFMYTHIFKQEIYQVIGEAYQLFY